MRMYRNGISEDDITFMVTPRINAASRLGKAEDAFRLLATDDDVEAGMLAEKLDKINDERKGIVAALVKELKHVAKERVEGKRVLVIGNPDWRPRFWV
jgi:single-stranded-DNA-specific exonuclease